MSKLLNTLFVFILVEIPTLIIYIMVVSMLLECVTGFNLINDIIKPLFRGSL